MIERVIGSENERDLSNPEQMHDNKLFKYEFDCFQKKTTNIIITMIYLHLVRNHHVSQYSNINCMRLLKVNWE